MAVSRDARTEVEIEWQLDALDLRPVERWLARLAPSAGQGELPGLLPDVVAAPLPARRLADTYFDTDDWRIGAAGYVLRVRRKGRRLEATLKQLSVPADGAAGSGDGLRRRLEATEPLGDSSADDSDSVGAALSYPGDGPVGRRLKALVGSRALRPVLLVRTRRRPFDLVVNGERVGELALDETTISAGGELQRLHMRRVEVEVNSDWVEALSPVVEQLRRECGLSPAMLSKFEAGLLAAGIAIARPAEHFADEASAVGPASTAGELAIAVIGRDGARLLAHEPGTRLGDDVEDLHQMRVATRRLRASLSLFHELLPVRSVALRSELSWLADLLGAVRDLDVQLENLRSWTAELPADLGPVYAELSMLLHHHREVARSQLLLGLDSRRYERLVTGLRSLVGHGALRRAPSTCLPALVVVPALVEQRHRQAVKAARRAKRTGAMADSHKLRIACKRLRYSLEFASGLYGNVLRPFVKQLSRLQDDLGLIQDAESAFHRLRELALNGDPAERGGDGLPAATIFALGLVAQQRRLEAGARLSRLGPSKRVLASADWQEAWAVMSSRRADLEPAPARAAAAAPDQPAPDGA